MRYELIIALRYLRARRKDAFISITTLFTAVGVTIGVAALVVMLAVMSGFETNLRQRMLSLSPQVQVQSFGGAISNYAAIEDRIDHTPGVAGSDPFIVGQGLISSAHGIRLKAGSPPSAAAERIRSPVCCSARRSPTS